MCENVGSSSTFTLYGNATCPSGYATDFVGYVFSTYHGSYHRKGDFICVDRNPEAYNNGRGNSNDDQGRLYPVEIGVKLSYYRVSSLKCIYVVFLL